MKIKDLRRLALAKDVLMVVALLLIMGSVLFLAVYGGKAGVKALINYFGVEEREQLTDQYSLVTYNNGNVKIKSKNPAKKISKRFDSCYSEDTYGDSVLFLRKNGKEYTFSLKSGALSKPYSHLGDVGYGRSWVACIDENDKLGFVDIHTGKEVLPCQFSTSECCYDVLPFFDGDYCIFPLYSGYYGIIDTTGKVLVGGEYIYKTEVFDGYLVECENNKKSLYSKDLQCVLANKDDISFYRVGIVYTDSLCETPMLTDFEFTQATPVYTLYAVDECRSILETDYREEETQDVYYTFETDYDETGIGMIDQKMNMVIDPKWKWDEIVSLGNGFFVCFSDCTGFLMDRNGNFVVPKSSKPSLAKH